MAPPTEWIGGVVRPPIYIAEDEGGQRPVMALWQELPSGLVVGETLRVESESEGVLGEALVAALAQPLAGPRREPSRFRVANEKLAKEVADVLGDDSAVVVAPTPEIDELAESLREHLSAREGEAGSYLQNGRLSHEVVGDVFAAARLLYLSKPWEDADDGRTIRLDIPHLHVDGACISVIGALGESLGIIVFPSLEAFEAFLAVAEAGLPDAGPVDLGSGWLSLNFENGSVLPSNMRREIARHGWPVADAAGYPTLLKCDREGVQMPLVDRDLHIAAAAARALASLTIKHPRWFDTSSEPISESIFPEHGLEHDVEVRLTVPYEASSSFGLLPAGTEAGRFKGEAARHTATSPSAPAAAGYEGVGRNDPCPCGSGRKFKKCHLRKMRATQSDERRPMRLHELDEQLSDRLFRFAAAHFGERWLDFQKDFVDPEGAAQLSLPWAIYGRAIDGKTVAEAYLEEHGRRCSADDRAWLLAQQAAWLSVWEIVEIERGTSLTLVDQLSGERRRISERAGSEGVAVRDALLARVVDAEGVSILAGSHPRPLLPGDAADVVARARKRLRRKSAVPVNRLRNAAFGSALIKLWEEAVETMLSRPSIPSDLQNTDGETLLITTDHFDIEAGRRDSVAEALAGMRDVDGPDTEGPSAVFRFVRSSDGGPKSAALGGSTLIGLARLNDETLRLETNSRERADALRQRVETACGELLRHRLREHTDPLSPQAGSSKLPEVPNTAPASSDIVREFKRRHYADWADHPLPALDGQTPRDAIRTKEGRARVDLVLKEMENLESRAAQGEPFDFGRIRRELGIG